MVVNSGVPSPGGPQPTGKEKAAGELAAGTGGAAGGSEAAVGVVVTPQMRHKIEKLALELLKMENEKFSIPALKLLLSCMYVGEYFGLNSKENNKNNTKIKNRGASKWREAGWGGSEIFCNFI